MKTSRIKTPALLYGLLPALCCLVQGLSDRLYTDIDSYLVSITCAGLYGSDTICPVLHPLLSLLIGPISRLWPGADWFAVFSQAFVVLAVWWTGTLLAFCLHEPAKRFACLFIFCFALLQQSLFNINYTVWCGLFSFVGGTTLLLALRVRQLPRCAPAAGALFLALSVLWRPESAALLLPFMLLALAGLLVRRQVSRQLLCRVFLPSVLVLVFLGLFSIGFYAFFPHRQAAESYSNARRSLVDYSHQPWEVIQEEMTARGLSENDYNALSASILLDTEIATSDTLRDVASLAKTPASHLSTAALWEALCSLPGVFSTSLLRILIALAGLLLLLLLISGLHPIDKVVALLALGGGGLICLYYQCKGRLPERLAACVLLAILAVLLSLFLSAPSRQFRSARWFWRVACAVTGCLLCLFLWKNRYQYHILQPALCAGVHDSQPETEMPGNDDSHAVYLWNSTTLALYMTDHYLAQGKLPDRDFVQQNLPWGEWNTSGQVCFGQLLDALEMPNPMQSLLTRSETYLVCTDMTLVQTWLQEHYDSSATFRQIGTVEVFAMGEVPVWQACTGNGV